MAIKVKLLVSKAPNSCYKSLDFFQMLLALKLVKYITSLLSLKENKGSTQQGQIAKFP